MATVPRDLSPPSFLRLAGHPLRWRLLRELARSDRQVRELCALIGRPQSLVSYHLGRLRTEQAGLGAPQLGRPPRHLLQPRAGALRGTADGGRRGAAPGPAAYPAPSATAAAAVGPRTAAGAVPVHGNSARSQMAQALVEHLAGGAVEASSAGSDPKPLHPNAVRAMRRARHRHRRPAAPSTSASSPSTRFDYVISLCDRVREVCPEFPDQPEPHPLEHPRPGARGRHRRADLPRVPAHRHRARHPHRLPARRSSITHPTPEAN